MATAASVVKSRRVASSAARVNDPADRIKVSVNAGDISPPIYVPIGVERAMVVAVPGSGGSMLVEASWSSVAEVEAGTANWHNWDFNTVTAKAVQLVYKPTALRFTATTQNGVGEVAL